MRQALFLIGGLLFAGFLGPSPVLAQQAPPARVGRVALVVGSIAFHGVGETGWSAAGVNYPVATSGSFWTDPRSRAQLRIGPTTIGMANGTELSVTKLDEEATRLHLRQGRTWLHIREFATRRGAEMDIPQGAIELLEPGEYDIDSGSENAPARIVVYEGSARFLSGGTVVTIHRGERALLSGFNPVSIEFGPAVPDEFVAWARAQDYRELHLAAPRYVSPFMTGYAALDAYGSWEPSPEYAVVWFPRAVPANWAPYRFGHWAWIAPWGWTWVDREPWGFAPFHYGRWALIHGHWGWVPGRFERHPVYAPALVAFVGAVSISARLGPSVGWFPLAPGEIYWPSYSRNVDYIRRLNIASVRNVADIRLNRSGPPPSQVLRNRYANRERATIVPRHVFAGARPVAPARMHVAPTTLRQAPVRIHPPQVKPAARPPALRPGVRRPPAPVLRPPTARRETLSPPSRPRTPERPSVLRPPTRVPPVRPAHPPGAARRTYPPPSERRFAPTAPGSRRARPPALAPSERRQSPSQTRPHRPRAAPNRALERQRFPPQPRPASPPVRNAPGVRSHAVQPSRAPNRPPAHIRSHPAPTRPQARQRTPAHRAGGATRDRRGHRPGKD